MKTMINGMVITKCDICVNRDAQKDSGPCKMCSDNKMYISRFKADPIVNTLKEYWGIDGDIFKPRNFTAVDTEQ